MEIITSFGTLSISWIVVIFAIVAWFHPQLLPTLIEAIKGWSRR